MIVALFSTFHLPIDGSFLRRQGLGLSVLLTLEAVIVPR